MTENQIRNVHLRELSRYERLDKTVEVELGRKAKQGDKNSIDKLVLHNAAAAINTALYFQRVVAKKTLSEERACDIAIDCLYKAIKRFDPGKDCKLMTLAGRIIMDKIVDDRRKTKRTQIFMPIEADYANEETTPLNTDVITACINKLPSRTRELVKWAFKLDGYKDISEQEIADEYSLTVSRVQAIIREGIAFLRSYEGLLRSA